MTPEKRYQAAIALSYSAAFDEKTGAFIREYPREAASLPVPDVSACAALIVDALEAIEKTAGKGGRAAALKNICKAAGRDDLAGLYECGGRFIACSGFHAVRLFEDVPSVPHLRHGGPDLSPVFQDYDGEPVDLPTVAELKKHIAARGLTRAKFRGISGAEKKAALYPVGPAFFNPFYLLDVLQATGYEPETGRAALVRGYDGAACWKSPLRIETPAGDAVALPVNPK